MAKVLITEQYLQDVADAIRGLNGLTTTYTPAEMAAAIAGLVTGCDATAAKILSGAKALTQNGYVTGSMANNGAVSKSITPTTAAQSYTVPAGYHNGSGKVNVAAAPTSLIDGTATAADVLSGKTFFCDSYTAKTGTMTNRGAWASTVSFGSGASKSVTVPAGYHNGSGNVKVNIGSTRYVDWTSDALAIRSASDPNKRIGQLIIGTNGSYTYYGDRYPVYHVAASGLSGFSLCWMLVALPDSYLATS